MPLTPQQQQEERNTVEHLKNTYLAQTNVLEKFEFILNLTHYEELMTLSKGANEGRHLELMQRLGRQNDEVTNRESQIINNITESYSNNFSKGLKGFREYNMMLGAYRAKVALEMEAERQEYLAMFDENDPDRDKKADYLLINSGRSQTRMLAYHNSINYIGDWGSPLHHLLNELKEKGRNLKTITFGDVADSLGLTGEKREAWFNKLQEVAYEKNYKGEKKPLTSNSQLYKCFKNVLSDKGAFNKKKPDDPEIDVDEVVTMNMINFCNKEFGEIWHADGFDSVKDQVGPGLAQKIDDGNKYVNRLYSDSFMDKMDTYSQEFQNWVQNEGKAIADKNVAYYTQKSIEKYVKMENSEKAVQLDDSLMVDANTIMKPHDELNRNVEGYIEALMNTADKSKLDLTKTELPPFEELLKLLMGYQNALDNKQYAKMNGMEHELVEKAEEYLRAHRDAPKNEKESQRFDIIMSLYADKADISKLNSLLTGIKTHRQNKGVPEAELDSLKARTYINDTKAYKEKFLKSETILSKIEKEENIQERKKLAVEYLKSINKEPAGSEDLVEKTNYLLKGVINNMYMDKLSPKAMANKLRKEKDNLKRTAETMDLFAGNQSYNTLRELQYHYINDNNEKVERIPDFSQGVKELNDNWSFWYGSREYSNILSDLKKLNDFIHEADRKYKEEGVFPADKIRLMEADLMERMQIYINDRTDRNDARREELKREYNRKHNISDNDYNNYEDRETYVEEKMKISHERLMAMTRARMEVSDRFNTIDRYAINITKEQRQDMTFYNKYNKSVKNLNAAYKFPNITSAELSERIIKHEEMERKKEVRELKEIKDPYKMTIKKDAIFSSMLRTMYVEGLKKTYAADEAGLKKALGTGLQQDFNHFCVMVSKSDVGKEMYSKLDGMIKKNKLSVDDINQLRDNAIIKVWNAEWKKSKPNQRKIDNLKKFIKQSGTNNAPINPARQIPDPGAAMHN